MDLELIKTLLDYFEEYDLDKFSIVNGDFEINMEKSSTNLDQDVGILNQVSHTQISELDSIQALEEEEPAGFLVRSPLVGTFYRAPSSDSAPFVEPGDMVSVGDTLCIVESMKMFNEIKADTSGRVVRIHPKNGEMVEYDQVLIEIEE